MCVVDRECVGIIPTRTALTRIGKVLEAIKAPACGVVLIRELPAHQIVLCKAMVDLNVKLLIGALARTRPKPVLLNASTGDVGLRKVAHHLLRHRVNQIAGSLSGRSRAGPCGDIVEGNEHAAYDAACIGIENPGVRVPDLTSLHTASPDGTKRASLCG